MFGLLPQVMDRETSVQEKCFDLLEEMILQNLKPVGKYVSTVFAICCVLYGIAVQTHGFTVVLYGMAVLSHGFNVVLYCMAVQTPWPQ